MSRLVKIIESMSLEEKVGQLFLMAFPGKDAQALRPLIERFGICGCYISQQNAATFDEARSLSTDLQKLAQQKGPALPLLLGADQEGAWGVLVPQSHTGPGNLALGAHPEPQLVSNIYRIFGQEMKAAGYNAIFAPCADTNSNPLSPIIGTRSFGEKYDHVAKLVKLAITGAQQANILCTVKHFPGHGATAVDTHREIPTVNKPLDQLLREDLLPFLAGIHAKVDMVMTSHISYPKIDQQFPATLSSKILQGVLRDRLGFEGVIISDSMNMGAIRKHYDPAESTLLALKAGVDIVMLAEEHYDHDQDYLKKQIASLERVYSSIKSGELNETLINKKLERIIALKERINHNRSADNRLSEAEKRATERQAARGSICLVKDHWKNWPVDFNEKEPIICINCTPRSAYTVIYNERGIGPNQTTPAFDTFWQTLSGIHPDIKCVEYEAAVKQFSLLGSAHRLLLVTEDYPLPGEDLPKEHQQSLVKKCLAEYGARCIVVALRSPYELLNYPNEITYLCSYSSRSCSATAMAHLIGEKIAPTGINHLMQQASLS